MIISKEKFYLEKLNLKKRKNTKWTESYVKRTLKKLQCKHVVSIDGSEKFGC